MPKKKWTYEMIKELVELFGCRLVDIDFSMEDVELELKCTNNHNYKTTLKNFNSYEKRSKSKGCNICKRNNKSNASINKVGYEYVKKNIEKLGYSILTKKEDFKGVSNNIEIICQNGHYQEVSFEVFNKRKINGQKTINKCFKCFDEYKFKLAKDRANKLGYILHTDKYSGVDDDIELTCSNGHKWITTYDRFVRVENLCLECNNILLSINQRLSFLEVKKRIEVEGYMLLSKDTEYENNESLLNVKCPKGHRYKVTLSNFQQGKRCARCIQSKGENEIGRILNEMSINFKRQYKFTDCKHKKYLPFDFYLPDYNMCIEYDGEQHFKDGHFGMTEEEFEELKLRDNIKSKYCKDNNINLIRIPYWEFDNIENILKITFNL